MTDERAVVSERGAQEALADPRVAARVRVQAVGEVADVVGAEQLEPVEVVEVAVALLAPLRHDLGDDLAAPPRGHAAHAGLTGRVDGLPRGEAVGDRRARSVLGDGEDDE